MTSPTVVKFPPKLKDLFKPYRYKVFYGGRGGARSWSCARALLLIAANKPTRVLCAREVQKSIKQSVHTLLVDQIQSLGLGYFYDVTDTSIRGLNGSSFSFTGLSTHTVESIKSIEGTDICWVEEGQTVQKKSWEILLPTIRALNSEIWVTFNPDLDTDDTYVRFVLNPPENVLIVKLSFEDNPWFPDVLERERQHCLRSYPKAYENIWLGIPKTVVDGAIYADEYQLMVDEHRITKVSHDPILKTHLVFDLGFNDAMAIAFVQRSGSELRVIDYIEDTHRTLDWYSDRIKEKGYNFGVVFLPHDAVAKDYKTGKSAAEIMSQFGWKVDVIQIGDVENGIRLARMAFPRVWLDKEKTAVLQECLKRYRRVTNQSTGQSGTPLHDQYSHGADCFRYMATAADSMRNDNIKKRPVGNEMRGGWMS